MDTALAWTRRSAEGTNVADQQGQYGQPGPAYQAYQQNQPHPQQGPPYQQPYQPYQPGPYGPQGQYGQYGPGTPYSGPYPPPTPPRRRRRRWLIPLLVVVFLLLGGCGVGGWLIFRAVAGPVDAVNDYLSDLRDGRYVDAYERLCSSLRSQGTPEEFETVIREREDAEGRITSFSVSGVNVEAETGEGTTRTVTVDIQRGGGASATEVYSVGRENDKYCLLST